LQYNVDLLLLLHSCSFQALLGQLPLLLPHICSVWHELEASGSDDPNSERGDMLYGGSIWSSGHGSSWNADQGGRWQQ